MSWKENSFFLALHAASPSMLFLSPRMHPSLTHLLTKPLNPSRSPAASAFSLHTCCHLPSCVDPRLAL